MNLNLNRTPAVLSLVLMYIFLVSCSKDADLLSEYVINDDISQELQNLVVDDQFYLVSSNSMVLDVLNNDQFQNLEQVTITRTTDPQHGDIVINEDNTLTYTPNAPVTEEVPIEDTFVYTAEEVEEDGTVSEEQGTVTVSNDDTQRTPNEISAKIQEWKRLFDQQVLDDQHQIALSLSGDGGDIYYLDVSPYVYMFQVTGEESYMDFAVQLFQNAMTTANDGAVINDGYLGWKDDDSGVTKGVQVNDGTEVSLAEGRGMRTVARMLWVLAKSPGYLNKGDNQQKFTTMFNWFEQHIWNKWISRGINNLYRSRTHMSSHWGQIAWFLYEITEESKYRNIYIGWSSGFLEGEFEGESMRNQLNEISISGQTGYVWNSRWGSTSGATDVSHANAEVELMVLGAEMNDYWTLDDMNSLITTFDELIFTSNRWDQSSYYIDGSGSEPAMWDQGWIQLGRFSQNLQNKLEQADLLPTYYNYQKVRMANLAYNQAYLEGNFFYPEE